MNEETEKMIYEELKHKKELRKRINNWLVFFFVILIICAFSWLPDFTSWIAREL